MGESWGRAWLTYEMYPAFLFASTCKITALQSSPNIRHVRTERKIETPVDLHNLILYLVDAEHLSLICSRDQIASV